VIARSSSYLHRKSVGVTTIAKELGLGFAVESSVRKESSHSVFRSY
jgi:TolB-like protein